MSSGDSLFHINHEKYDYIEKISDNNNADSRMSSVTFQNGDNKDSNVSWDEDYSRRKAIFMENTKALLSKRNYSSGTDNMTTSTRDVKYSESPTHALLELEENLIQLDKNRVKISENSSRNSMISLKDDSSINNIDDNRDQSITDNNKKVNNSYYFINKPSNTNSNVCLKQKISINNDKTHLTNKQKVSLKNRKVHHINKEFELPSQSVSPNLNNSSKISSLVARKLMFTKSKANNNNNDPITFDTSEKSNTIENINKNTNNKNTNYKSPLYMRKCKDTKNNDNKINYVAFKSDTKSCPTLTKSMKSDTNFGEDMSLFLSISSNGVNENNNEATLLYHDNVYCDEGDGDRDGENGEDYLETVSINNNDLYSTNNVTNCGDNSLESNISVKNIKLNIRDKSTANQMHQLNKSKRLMRASCSQNKKGHNSCGKAGNSNKIASREESKENKTEYFEEKPKLKYISKKYNWADGLKIDELEVELDKVKRELKYKNEKIYQLESRLEKNNKNDVVKPDISGSKFTNNNTNESDEDNKSDKMYQYKQADKSNQKPQNSRVESNENLSSIKDYNPNSATVLKNRIKDLESQIQDLQEANDVASKFITSFKDKAITESHLDSNKIISDLILRNKSLKEMVDNLKQSLPNETRSDIPSSKFLRQELDNLKEDLLSLRNQNQMIVMENLKLKQQLKCKDESFRPSELENENFYKSFTKPTELMDNRNDSYAYDSEEVMDSNYKYPDNNSKRSISGNNCNTKDIVQPINIAAENSKYNPRTMIRNNDYNYTHPSQATHATMLYNDNVMNNTNTSGSNNIMTNNIPNKERHLTRSDLTINQTSGQQRSDLIGRMNNDNCSNFNDSHQRNLLANDYGVTDDQSSPAVSSSSNHSQSTDDILREVQQGIPELSHLQDIDNCPDQYSTQSHDISKYSKIHSDDMGLINSNKPSSIQQSSFSTLHRTAIAPKSGSDVVIGDIIKFIRQGGRISKGLVHFIGNLPRRNDIYIGVELELEDGKHDGVYEGVRYFKCKQNKGVFVAFNKVIMVYSKRHDFC